MPKTDSPTIGFALVALPKSGWHPIPPPMKLDPVRALGEQAIDALKATMARRNDDSPDISITIKLNAEYASDLLNAACETN